MQPSDKDIWEVSTTTTHDHVLMMVDTGNGSYIYGRSLTLSRAMPLYIECGHHPITPLVMTDDIIRIPHLIMDESAEDLEYTNEALESLKGFPVEVWSWKFHDNKHVEPLNVPNERTK
ncbi:MAG: hypothetical protein H9W81_09785, partial [Enterococcus sp.]|nr:hypothetical protein [Enterococcus sp.]